MLNELVKDRLLNWKFSQAQARLMDQKTDGNQPQVSEEEEELVTALAVTFGDAGWGFDGSMGVIVAAAVRDLNVTDPTVH